MDAIDTILTAAALGPVALVMRAPSGAGKSHWLDALRVELGAMGDRGAPAADGFAIASADHWFTPAHDGRGPYRFVPAEIQRAHDACTRRWLELLRGEGDSTRVIACDNTGVTGIELAPYVQTASAIGRATWVVQIDCDPAVAAARNAHGVPADAVRRMHARMAAETLPPWWRVLRVTT